MKIDCKTFKLQNHYLTSFKWLMELWCKRLNPQQSIKAEVLCLRGPLAIIMWCLKTSSWVVPTCNQSLKKLDRATGSIKTTESTARSSLISWQNHTREKWRNNVLGALPYWKPKPDLLTSPRAQCRPKTTGLEWISCLDSQKIDIKHLFCILSQNQVNFP